MSSDPVKNYPPLVEGLPDTIGTPTVELPNGSGSFNLDKYQALLDELGIGEERSRLLIQFKGRPSISEGLGRYRRIDDDDPTKPPRITVYAELGAFELGDYIINNILIHETIHFAQDIQGRMPSPEAKKRRTRLIRVASALGTLAFSATLMRTTGFVDNAKELAEVGGFSSAIPLLLGSYIGKHIDYYTTPIEREARKLARDPRFQNIFTSTP